MINGVLVERTVKDVVPTLKTTAENLKKVLDDLVVQYKSKQDEMESWKVRHLPPLRPGSPAALRNAVPRRLTDVTVPAEKEQHSSRPAMRQLES
jgi:polyhydroxyalkanoate synthesis regulator phasin